MSLKESIAAQQARIGVIGLGYVGLPLAAEFAKAGFRVTGFDVDESKVDEINAGRSYILDVATEDIAAAVANGTLRATTDMSQLRDIDVVDICVPTPLRKTRDPDLSYVVQAVDAVKGQLRAGQLIVLESTTYPGTTDEVVQPALEEGGLKAGADFFLAFSPERVDPGNQVFSTRTIPKVVGGVNPESTELACALYRSVVDTVVAVSSTQVAEMVKLLENTFRAVNIGLVNEIALMAHRMDINVWEVIDAAGTKTRSASCRSTRGLVWGGTAFRSIRSTCRGRPGKPGSSAGFIELAGQINGSMPAFVVERVAEALNTRKKAINGSRVHLFGVAYKKDVSDMRESPALDVLELLHRRGAIVTYTDPYVEAVTHGELDLASTPEQEAGPKHRLRGHLYEPRRV